MGNLVFRAKRYLAPRLPEPAELPAKRKPPAHVFINLARKRKGQRPESDHSYARPPKQPRQQQPPDMADNGEQAESQPEPAAALGGGGGGGLSLIHI